MVAEGKIVFIDSDGREHEIREVHGLPEEGTVIMMAAYMLSYDDTKRLEAEFSEKLNRKVVLVDSRINRILAIQ